MKYTTAMMLLIVTCLTACNNNSSGRVAVIDLDKIASVTGRDTAIAEQVQLFTSEQEARLNTLREEFRSEIEQQQKKLGKKPAKEKQEKLDQLTQRSELKLRRAIARVEEEAAQLRINLVMAFKKEVEPLSTKIAAERGMGVVMIKQNAMLSVSAESDITNDVIDEFRKKPLAESAVSEKLEIIKAKNVLAENK